MNEAFVPQPIPARSRAAWTPDAMAEARAICERWGLDLAAVIGTTEAPPGGLGEDALHRVGALVGIDRAALVIFGAEQGREWMHRPNAGLAGRSPAAVMQEDGLAGLLAVRGIAEAMRCGIFAPLAAHAPAGPPMKFRLAPS